MTFQTALLFSLILIPFFVASSFPVSFLLISQNLFICLFSPSCYCPGVWIPVPSKAEFCHCLLLSHFGSQDEQYSKGNINDLGSQERQMKELKTLSLSCNLFLLYLFPLLPPLSLLISLCPAWLFSYLAFSISSSLHFFPSYLSSSGHV